MSLIVKQAREGLRPHDRRAVERADCARERTFAAIVCSFNVVAAHALLASCMRVYVLFDDSSLFSPHLFACMSCAISQHIIVVRFTPEGLIMMAGGLISPRAGWMGGEDGRGGGESGEKAGLGAVGAIEQHAGGEGAARGGRRGGAKPRKQQSGGGDQGSGLGAPSPAGGARGAGVVGPAKKSGSIKSKSTAQQRASGGGGGGGGGRPKGTGKLAAERERERERLTGRSRVP